MMCRQTTLALLTGLIFAAVTAAQPTAPAVRTELAPFSEAQARSPGQATAMYEDIEIMGRILDRTLRRLGAFGAVDGLVLDFSSSTDAWERGSSAAELFQRIQPRKSQVGPDKALFREKIGSRPAVSGEDALSDWLLDSRKADLQTHSAPPKVEGVYLKNYGVVFSLTVPVHFMEPFRLDDKPATKPLSDWDRTRKELRGEKLDASAAPAKSKDVTIADILLRVLAENGSHFAQLGERDQLTIAATLRQDVQSCAKCHDGSNKPSTIYQALSDASAKEAEPKGAAPAGNSGSGVAPNSPYQSLIYDNLLLGDLDAKQGLWQRAATAYEKAAEAVSKQLSFLEGTPAESRGGAYRRELLIQAVELQTKLARAYQTLKDEAKSQAALNAGAGYAQRASAGAKPAKEAANKDAALPAKLIISVSKSAADQFAAGKMTFDEFKKAATVDYFAFSTPAKP
jgi:hypothetical protein